MKQCPACGLTYKDNLEFCPADGTRLIDRRENRGIYVGQILNQTYEVKRRLDISGLWDVYLGNELATGRAVAIKVTPLASPELNAREKKYLARMDKLSKMMHPGLIKVIDYGTLCASLYVICEYISGKSLKQVIEDVGNLSLSLSLNIIEQILHILTFLHQHAVLHLDLRPSKIFLTQSTTGSRFVKIDAGGLLLDLSAEDKQAGLLVPIEYGSHYTAPELFAGRAPDFRCDVYSAGIIFYQMLSGVLPFPSGTLLHHHSNPAVPPIGRLKPNLTIPGKIEKVAAKSIQWTPQRRYPGPEKFLDAVIACRQKRRLPQILLIVLFCGLLIFGIKYHASLTKVLYGYVKQLTPDRRVSKRNSLPPKLPQLSAQEKYKQRRQKLKGRGKNKLTGKDEMCYIAGGTAYIGNERGDYDERPVTEIKILPFYIDRMEVTNAQYQLFVDSTGHKAPGYWPNGRYPPGKSNYPVVEINWYSADLYACWLGKRLPLEIEWGKSRTWPGERRTQFKLAVGKYFFSGVCKRARQILAYGRRLFAWQKVRTDCWIWPGMHGNGPQVGMMWEIKQDRVIKGGSFRCSSFQARTTYRDGFLPKFGRDDIGFRCVKDVEIK